MPRAAPRIPRYVPIGKRKPSDRMKRAHLDFVRSLRICIACGRVGPVEAAHVRESRAEHQKFNAMKLKDDRFALPLCHQCHIGDQHGKHGEPVFWARLGIDAVDTALRLFAVTGNYDQGIRAIERARQSIALKANRA